jgi:hypothetical protein
MRRTGRVGLALAAVAVVTVGALTLAPERDSRPGAGDDEIAAYRSGELAVRAGHMDARRDVVLSRLQAKVRMTNAVYAGEITLDQAVGRFREMTEHDPEAVELLRTRYGGTGDEAYYRNVLGFVRGAARQHPDEAKVILPRLEAEFARRFPPAGIAEQLVQ